jgi:hypothetical protein
MNHPLSHKGIRAFFLLQYLLLMSPGTAITQNIPPPENVLAFFNNDIIPIIDVYWQYDPAPGFLYYLVERDGDSVGVVSNNYFYTEQVPCFCTYCYRVYAVYIIGSSGPSAPSCTFDSVALIVLNPVEPESWLIQYQKDTLPLVIKNIGGEPLQFSFPDYTGGPVPDGFIADVDPASGSLPAADSLEVSLYFDAGTFAPGVYQQYLVYESDDPYHIVDSLLCTLNVDSLPAGVPLPFMEDWSNGNQAGFWTFEGNWKVSGQYGNPQPSAEFSWDPMLEDYTKSLTSGYLNGVTNESKGDPYVAGDFILAFDISLFDNSLSGTEKITVEILAEGSTDVVAVYDNQEGSYDWNREEIIITDEAFGKVFQVRFTASGTHSENILLWYVDNISIERVCYPPKYLYVFQADVNIMELNWAPPFTGNEGEWINWDNGVMEGGIGLTGGGVFSVAARWEPDMLALFQDMFISKVRFAVYNNALTTNLTLKVWKGPQASTLLYEMPVDNITPGEWNEILLSDTVPIDILQELWIGYTCDSPDGENPAGYDDGPAISGFGDMITLDGIAWDPISSFGAQFNLNWNIQALLVDMADKVVALPSFAEDLTIYKTPDALPTNDLVETSFVPIGLSQQKITGYHIYFNDDGTGYTYLDRTTDTFYSHIRNIPFDPGGLYCYYVTAVYEDCEASSNESCWIAFFGIKTLDGSGKIEVFPIPAKNSLFVSSTEGISRFCLLEMNGRILCGKDLHGMESVEIDVAEYEPGIYLLRVHLNNGIVVRKVIIE